MSTQERYRLGSLGDLVELLVDGWEITGLHYADACGTPGAPDDRPAAFVDLARPDLGPRGLYIPEDDRAFSHRALIGVFRESPHIWKHRSAATVRERLEQAATSRPEPESWGEVADPAELPLDVSPESLRGVVALGRVESIDDVTVALLSLERFQDFSRLRYLAHTLDPGRRGSLAALDVVAVDELGRRYRTASLGVERSGNRLEGVIALAPGIPAKTTSLTVTIGTLGEGGPDGILGPWVFPIRLPAPTLA